MPANVPGRVGTPIARNPRRHGLGLMQKGSVIIMRIPVAPKNLGASAVRGGKRALVDIAAIEVVQVADTCGGGRAPGKRG